MITNNSIWPNGIKTDDEGYTIFYPLGTNKMEIPTDVNLWPEGNKIISPFVYDVNDKLVGFCDTKSMITLGNNTTITLPYEHIEVDFSSIVEGTLTIDAPNATVNDVKYNINPADLLPADYKYVEYLENPGYQFIDTELPTSNKTEIRAMAMVTMPFEGNAQYYRLYGNSTSGEVPRLSMTLCVTEGGLTVASRFGNNSTQFGSGLTNDVFSGRKYEYVVSYKECGVVGVRISTRNYDEEWTCENTCLLFVWDGGVGIRGRVYSFKMKEDGALQRNFIPALDPEDTPCMFDTITRTPFYNQGTGDFLYPGAESQVVTSDLDETFYAKMTPHGIKRLYKVPSHVDMSKDEYAMANGYKQLVEPPMPQTGYWIPQWSETDTQVICNWIETEAPSEEI